MEVITNCPYIQIGDLNNLYLPINHVLVKVEKEYQDEVVLFNGMKLFVATTYNPTAHATIKGTLFKVSDSIGKDFDLNGARAGDTVYFRYSVIDKENICYVNGEKYLRFHVEAIFCHVRAGVITMTNHWCLVEPVTQEIKSVVVIPGSANHKKYRTRGRLRHTMQSIYRPGDLVCFKGNNTFENEIEGYTYFTMKDYQIIGKIITED